MDTVSEVRDYPLHLWHLGVDGVVPSCRPDRAVSRSTHATGIGCSSTSQTADPLGITAANPTRSTTTTVATTARIAVGRLRWVPQ